jgi:hypothetical protein
MNELFSVLGVCNEGTTSHMAQGGGAPERQSSDSPGKCRTNIGVYQPGERVRELSVK